jgi:hypothetical protein
MVLLTALQVVVVELVLLVEMLLPLEVQVKVATDYPLLLQVLQPTTQVEAEQR